MEFCTDLDRSTLELSVFSKNCVFFSRCSYLKSIAYLKYNAIRNIDIFNFKYADNLCKKSSSLCATRCSNLSNEIKNIKIGISKACNYNCYHCFNKCHEDTLLDKETYFYLLNTSKGHNFESLMLGHQGEVFVYYDEILTFLESLSKNDFKKVIFQTNLSLLDDHKIDELYQTSIKTGVEYQFYPSINGITQETYKNITGCDTFGTVISNLCKVLNTFGENNVKVSFTIKKFNILDLPNVNQFFKNLGIKFINISYDLYDSYCKEVYLYFLNKGYLKCIYDNAMLENATKSSYIKKYSKFSEAPPTIMELTLKEWLQNNTDNLSEIISLNKEKIPEKISLMDDYDSVLTIGITCHGEQILSDSILKLIIKSTKIQFLISNDKGQNFNLSLKEIFKDAPNVKFIYSKPGIENNRQNILNNTYSKYLYVIDYDDEIKINEEKLINLLEKLSEDIVYIHPYENEVETEYTYHSDSQIFVTTWAQIFSTNFIKSVGGYIQTWNFYHEEFGTNANILANIYFRNIDFSIYDINDKDIIYYNHILDDAVHNSTLKINFKKILKFFKGILKNDSITYKKLFLTLFLKRISLMNLSKKNEKKLIKLIKRQIRRAK